MTKSLQQAESESLSEVNKKLHSEVRINNRNLENSHPSDCQCLVHKPYFPKGIPSIAEENKKKDELDYPK